MFLRPMNSLSNLKDYIPENHLNNLHENAFIDVFNVISSFMQKGLGTNEVGWVCNAAPGLGKTTALKTIMKIILQKSNGNLTIPLLIVCNNNDTMNNLQSEISEYASLLKKDYAIKSIDKDNVQDWADALFKYKFVCITQQRLRDMALGYGNFSLFSKYHDQERFIICDEMLEFTDEAVWDISSENNCVDWFDKLVKDNEKDFNTIEVFRGRLLINLALVNEFLENKTNSTKKLIRFFEGSENEKIIEKLMSLISQQEYGNLDSIK